MDEAGQQAPHSRSTLWLAYVSGGFGLAMFAQVSFLVPLRARELGASFDVIGLLVGAGALAPAILAVTLGAVVDRLGPKHAFVLGTGAASIIWALFLFVSNYWWLLPLQLILGPSFSLGWVASQSYITSLGSAADRPRLTGRFSFFSNVGSMIGPILVGGAAQLAGFRWAFLVPVLYSATFAVIGLLLVETRSVDYATRAAQGAGLRAALELVSIRGIRVALLLTFARLWTVLIFTTFYPVYLVDRDVAAGLVGAVMAVSGLVAALMAPTTEFFARLGSQENVTAASLGAGALALVIAPHLALFPWVFLVPILIGIGRGLSLPLLLSIVTSVAPPQKYGVALGLRDMVNQTAATLAPVAVGPVITALGMVLGFTAGGALGGTLLGAAALLHRIDLRSSAATD